MTKDNTTTSSTQKECNNSKKSVFQVIGNYEAVDTGKNEYLVASPGDIIVDCAPVDDNWFRGKCVRSGVYGLIPKANIVSVQQHEYREIEPELIGKQGTKGSLHDQGIPEEEESVNDNTYDEADDDHKALIKDTKKTSSPSSKSGKTKKSPLSRLGEGNYVDMSSEETLNCIDEEENDASSELTPLRKGNGEERAIALPKRSPIPKPPRHPSVSEGSGGGPRSGTNDEGYNSASHYSGENPDAHVVSIFSGGGCTTRDEDEDGYEVPKIHPSLLRPEEEEEESKPKLRKKNRKKKSLMMLWKGRGAETESKVGGSSQHSNNDEARQNYYDPPADIRDNYFLPYSKKPTTRVVLSFIASLGISVTLFLVLLLLVNFHTVLSFSISTVIFIVLFVVPVTLYHRGVLCVTLLVFPSLVGHRSKIAIFILLTVFLVIGPVFGTRDKINIAGACVGGTNNDDFFTNVTAGSLAENCLHAFGNIAANSERYCSRIYVSFKKACDTWSIPMTTLEKLSCNQTEEYYCMKDRHRVRSLCMSFNNVSEKHLSELRVTSDFKSILFYLLPFLFLMVLAEAYNYNKVYLTTKNTDNIYITQRLRKLDTERRNRGLTDLILPLTRIELYTYLVRGNLTTTKAERQRIFRWLKILAVFVFMTVTLVLIENAVDGILLSTLSNPPCSLHYRQYNVFRYRVVIYALLGGVLFIILVQSHVLRLRSVICDYIYPEMIETRSKHLYYKILHDRHAFARHVRRKIQLLSEEKRLRMRISFFSKIYNVLPDRLQWACRKFTVRTCMICDSISYQKTIECIEKSCYAHYCFECHVDAGQNCLTCKAPAPASLKHNSVPAPRSSFCV